MQYKRNQKKKYIDNIHWVKILLFLTVVIVSFIISYIFRNKIPFYFLFPLAVFLSIQFMIYRNISRYVFVFNLSFLLLAFSILEMGLWIAEKRNNDESTVQYHEDYFVDDYELGYAIGKGHRDVKTVKKSGRNTSIYEVVYEIGNDGLRVTPHTQNGKVFFFFGGSYTFGEGVENHETLPAQTAKLEGVTSHNFGVHGYGPHQFLRSLETGRPKALGINSSPDLIVFTFIPHHIDRAAGRAFWDDLGPSYSITQSGEVIYNGPFNDRDQIQKERDLAWRKAQDAKKYPKSFVYNKTKTIFNTWTVSDVAPINSKDADEELFLAILKKSQELSRDDFESELLVINWDAKPNPSPGDIEFGMEMDKRIRALGLPTIQVSQLDPFLLTSEAYIKNDGHPTGKAYRIVAEAISDYLLNGKVTIESTSK